MLDSNGVPDVCNTTAPANTAPSKRWSEQTSGFQVPLRMRHTERPSVPLKRGGDGGDGRRGGSSNYLATKVMSLVQSGRYEDALLLAGRQRQALTEGIYRRLWEDAQFEQQEKNHQEKTENPPSVLPLLQDLWLSHCNVQTTAEHQHHTDAISAAANDDQNNCHTIDAGTRNEPPMSPAAFDSNPPTPATAKTLTTASVLQDGTAGNTAGLVGMDETTATKRRLDFATPARHQQSQEQNCSSFHAHPTTGVAGGTAAHSILALASIHSVDDFLRVVFGGPSSKLPALHYGRLRSLYDSLCRQYFTTPNEVEFHAIFLTCASFASEPSATHNETVRSIHHVLSTVAARRGDVGALELLLMSQRESQSPTKSLRDIDKAIWTVEEKLYVLYFLPLHLKPETYLFLFPFCQTAQGEAGHDTHRDVIATWMRTRIQQTHAVPGLEHVTLSLCDAAIRRLDRINDIKEIQQQLLEVQEQGQVLTSEQQEPMVASAPMDPLNPSAPQPQPQAAPAETLSRGHQDNLQHKEPDVSVAVGADSDTMPFDSSGLQIPATNVTVTDQQPGSVPASQDDAHFSTDGRLAAERLKTSQLEKRVEDLTETIFALEEETCAAHEQLRKALGGNVSSEQLPKDEDIGEDNAFGEIVRALEAGLKREVQKRVDAEERLKSAVEGGVCGETSETTPADVLDGNDDDEVKTTEMNGEHEQQPKPAEKQTSSFPLAEMTTRIQGMLSRTRRSVPDWADFGDLLTSFMNENDELDGVDEDEKMIEHRDVVWFLNELKWRFDSIRSKCESDSAELQIQLGAVASLLEGHDSDVSASDWPTASVENGATKQLEVKERFQALRREYQKWRERNRSIMANLRSRLQQKDDEMDRVGETVIQKDSQIGELQATIEGLQREVEDTKQKSQALQEGAKVRLRYLESMIRELQGKMAAESGAQAS